MNKPVIEKSCSETRIFDFLSCVDREFIPFLSEKVNLLQYANKLAERGNNVFVVVDGHDIGHAAYYSNNLESRMAFLTSICVKPEFRGNGVAELLLEEVLRGAWNDGMKNLSLEVDERNQAAICFYRKYGFNDWGNNQMARLIEEKCSGTTLGKNRTEKNNPYS